MKKRTAIIVLLAVLTALFAATCAFAEPAHMRRIRLATELVNKMANEADASSLGDVIRSGKGVAIFPKVTKA